jgi:hypothetical protein
VGEQPVRDSATVEGPPQRAEANPTPAYRTASDSVMQALGFVVMDVSGEDKQKQFELLNQDGSAYLLVSFPRDLLRFNGAVDYSLSDSEAIPDELLAKHQFAPYLFEAESGQIIVFQVVGQDSTHYHVRPAPSAPYKRLQKSRLFQFEDTEAYLTGHFIYSLTEEVALFDTPGGRRTQTLNVHTFEGTLVASEIKGEWMKLECIDTCARTGTCQKMKKAYWMKWRTGQTLHVDVRFTC